MKKSFLSQIFRKAWNLVKEFNVDFSSALKASWKSAKLEIAQKAILANEPKKFAVVMETSVNKDVVKQTTGTVVIGKSYKELYEEKTGVVGYEPKARTWGVFSPSTGLIEHKGTSYLPLCFETVKTVKYTDLNGNEITAESPLFATVEKDRNKPKSSSDFGFRTPKVESILNLKPL